MAAASNHGCLTFTPPVVFNRQRLFANSSLRFTPEVSSAGFSCRRTRSCRAPFLFSDRGRRLSMESSDVSEIASEEIWKNSTLICAPIMADSVDKMVIDSFRAKELGADLVEIRLDSLKTFLRCEDLETIIQRSPLPTLFAYKPKWEGGQYEGDEKERQDVLRLAMELGADYVDVELQVADEFIKSIHGKKPDSFKVIVSSHNYQNTPSVEDLNDLVARIRETGTDIVKIATTALDITDVARMFQITKNSRVPTIGLVMGERGLISRILCAKFGGYLTFGTLEAGIVSAPGQPTIKDLLNLYNIRRIGIDTKVYGIIGKRVSHSKSPMVHNEAFKSVGFDGVFVPLFLDNPENFFLTYSSPDFAGFSCSISQKEAALRCCDEVDPLAKSIGAVNTVVRRQSDGKLLGYNTDCVAAISAIEDSLASKTLVVVGAGGAGKALAYGAKEKGAKVVIANRTYERARVLADAVGGDALSLVELDDFHPEDGMVLVNTTSIGMQPNVELTPISKHALKHYSLVFDAVYTPRITQLLREAEESGATTVSGLEMFVRQAYEQFEIFTGLPTPKELIWKIMSTEETT